jgi:Tfp pilus assembly protein PilO
MSESVYFVSISLPFITLLFIFGMKYFSAIQQAKARLANDEAYRKLAAQAASTQAEVAASLASINAALVDVKARLTAVEKVLKEVE